MNVGVRDKTYSFIEDDGEESTFDSDFAPEYDYRHPGDRDDDIDGTGLEAHVQPITTLAGQFVRTIAFASPPAAGGEPSFAELHASYPMQFAVRLDPVRKLLIYDCHAVKPKPHNGEPPTMREFERGNEVRRLSCCLARARVIVMWKACALVSECFCRTITIEFPNSPPSQSHSAFSNKTATEPCVLANVTPMTSTQTHTCSSSPPSL